MPVNREAVKRQIMEASDEVFGAVAEAVDERRGSKSQTLGSKALAVIEGLSINDLREWVNLARRKGDATMLQKLMDLAEMAETRKDMGDLTVNLVPYDVPDKSLPQIIDRCDRERFVEIRKACTARARREAAANMAKKMNPNWRFEFKQEAGEYMGAASDIRATTPDTAEVAPILADEEGVMGIDRRL